MMYLAALAAFWFCGIIAAPDAVKGIFLFNTILAQDLPTLWFVQLLICGILLTPLLLRLRSPAAGAGLTALLAVMAVLKLKFQWIDIRFFEVLPVFTLGLMANGDGPAACVLASRVVPWLFVPIFVLLGFAYCHWSDHAMIASVVRLAAMVPAIGFFMAFRAHGLLPGTQSFWQQVGSCWFEVFLWHRIVFTMGMGLFHPATGLLSALYVFGVLVPAVFTAAWVTRRVIVQISSRLAGENTTGMPQAASPEIVS